MTPSAVVENRTASNGMRHLLFVTLLQSPWSFRRNLVSTSGFTWPVRM